MEDILKVARDLPDIQTPSQPCSIKSKEVKQVVTTLKLIKLITITRIRLITK